MSATSWAAALHRNGTDKKGQPLPQQRLPFLFVRATLAPKLRCSARNARGVRHCAAAA